jgi:superfamily II DNA or RNA helicase
VRCLRQLDGTLCEHHGVEAYVADGSLAGREFEALKARFTAGAFPSLCLSRVGQEGHNLQNASVLCHLDRPWLPAELEQRVGRAARPGAVRG